ncbi:hypothetical protein [Achromobacter phage maay_LB1]|nr:hypothetical protein [Achromobacter phage maay_LB1]WNO49329.1 hypothetical protein [Achromobacter phage kwar_LB4]
MAEPSRHIEEVRDQLVTRCYGYTSLQAKVTKCYGYTWSHVHLVFFTKCQDVIKCFDQLFHIVEVIEYQLVTKACKAIGILQPTVTMFKCFTL